jgi:hypothetical protein
VKQIGPTSCITCILIGSSIPQMHSPPASFVRSLLLASIFSAATLCHPEEPSLAKPYLTEATGLVGSRCPEATRMKRASCFCGSKYVHDNCPNEDCPRIQLGQGSWHEAFPKLVELFHNGTLADHYPLLDFATLQSRVAKMGIRWSIFTKEMDNNQELRHPRQVHSNTVVRRRHQDKADKSGQDNRSKPEGQRQVWRKPRQTGSSHPDAASSSSSRLPEQLK